MGINDMSNLHIVTVSWCNEGVCRFYALEVKASDSNVTKTYDNRLYLAILYSIYHWVQILMTF